MKTVLPPHWYYEPEHHQRERQAIFAGNWQLFCPERELARPGSYKADSVSGWELIVTRTLDGELQAFHNVCRHRGAMVREHGCGSANLLVCPYHSWSYNLSGSLVRSPGFEEVPGFSGEEHGLRPARIATWKGLVFVCIDPAAAELEDWLGSLPELCREFGSPESQDYYDEFSVSANANWKLFCENTVEGYHLATVHKDLNQMVDVENSSIESYDDGSLVVFHVTYKSAGKQARGGTGIWWYRFPGFQGVCSKNSFRADRIEPLDASTTRIIDWSWNAPAMSPEEQSEGYRFARQIVGEDIGPCESIQKNMASTGYDGGLLSPSEEKHVIKFQQTVKALLQVTG